MKQQRVTVYTEIVGRVDRWHTAAVPSFADARAEVARLTQDQVTGMKAEGYECITETVIEDFDNLNYVNQICAHRDGQHFGRVLIGTSLVR